jgi:hypothetical protein
MEIGAVEAMGMGGVFGMYVVLWVQELFHSMEGASN